MIFASTTDKLQIITSSTADIDVVVDYADMDNTTKAVTVGRQLVKINTATTTDILAAPAAGFTRKLKYASINNVHASASNTITLQYNANATLYKVETWIVAAAERIAFVEGRGFRPLDSQGREEIPGPVNATGSAITAQIAAFSADTYIGASLNVANRLQAGTFFIWDIFASKGAGGTATPTFILRTGTAGAIGDAARLTMTGPAQTAVADTAHIRVKATFRVVGAAAVIRGDTQISHNLAATGFAATGPAGEAHFGGTSASFDSTPANTILGLSINPGAAGAWVVEQATLTAGNLLP